MIRRGGESGRGPHEDIFKYRVTLVRNVSCVPAVRGCFCEGQDQEEDNRRRSDTQTAELKQEKLTREQLAHELLEERIRLAEERREFEQKKLELEMEESQRKQEMKMQQENEQRHRERGQRNDERARAYKVQGEHEQSSYKIYGDNADCKCVSAEIHERKICEMHGTSKRDRARLAAHKTLGNVFGAWNVASRQSIQDQRDVQAQEEQRLAELRGRVSKSRLFTRRSDRRALAKIWSDWISAGEAIDTMIEARWIVRDRRECSMLLKVWKGHLDQKQLRRMAALRLHGRHSRSALARIWEYWLLDSPRGLQEATHVRRYERMLLFQVICVAWA